MRFYASQRTPRPRGLTRPLPRVRPVPPVPPVPVPVPLPRCVPPRVAEGKRDCLLSGVANLLGVGLEEVEGFSMKEVSVVLRVVLVAW